LICAVSTLRFAARPLARRHASDADRDLPREDGIVDWRYCRTGGPNSDFKVAGTHIGLFFNPSVYTIVATRLAEAKGSD
jgi:hypothetical protein